MLVLSSMTCEQRMSLVAHLLSQSKDGFVTGLIVERSAVDHHIYELHRQCGIVNTLVEIVHREESTTYEGMILLQFKHK